MITLPVGKTLGSGDLGLLVRDSNGALVQPFLISFQIFNAEGSLLFDSSTQGGLANPSLGVYYVSITIPTLWTPGQYKLAWRLQQYENGTIATPFEDFYVVSINPSAQSIEAPSVLLSVAPGINPKYAKPIMYVRELLSDTNPDRNYHFRPPTSGKQVAGFTSRVGYIWLDRTILTMLDIAIGQLNTWNPKTYYNFTLDSVPIDFGKCAALSAASKCLLGEGARWIAEEFGYSLNGVSLDLNKSGSYMQLGESYKAEFEAWAEKITEVRPCSVGLRQQRWILG